jgi:hypothetical protein
MSWITEKLLGLREVFFGGSQLPERGALEFAGDGVEVADDTVNKRTVITISGGEGDVDPTPDTLVQRGEDGEIRAVRVELVGARVLSGDPTQLGDLGIDTSTGHPYVYIDGLGETPIFRESVRWSKTSPDAAASDTLSSPIFDAPGYLWTITGVRFIPRNDVTADGTDYADLIVQIMNGSSLVGTAARADTKPSGANATGPWFSDEPVSFVLDPSLAFPLNGAYYARLTINKQGAGRIIPDGLLTMTVVPWKEP